MKRRRLVTELVNAVATFTNQNWPEDRHIFRSIRLAIESTIPAGHIVVVLTHAQAMALRDAAGYRLEMAGDGDHVHVKGSHADALSRAAKALEAA